VSSITLKDHKDKIKTSRQSHAVSIIRNLSKSTLELTEKNQGVLNKFKKRLMKLVGKRDKSKIKGIIK